MAGKKLSAREELLKLQRTLYDRIHADIADYLGKSNQDIRDYQNEYRSELKSYQRVASKAELIREVLKNDIVFLGDYHTLRQAQRTVIKILREIVADSRPIILALEMVDRDHQNHLDAYMQGRINEPKFLERIQYQKRWNFEWGNYRQLFDFAKKYRLKLIGLNCSGKDRPGALKKRDRVAAQIISELHRKHPSALIVVLYGDLHIARAHIPAHLKQLQKSLPAAERVKQMIIFQNSEELYWVLAARGLEQKVDVLKIDDQRYCVMNTPPWVKLQTYLNWLEHRSLIQTDITDELGDKEDHFDYYHRLWDMVDTIATFLDLNKSELDDFNVYTSGDIEFLDYLHTALKKRRQSDRLAVEFIRCGVIYDGSCLLADEGMIYLSSLNINQSAEKIAQFIHFRTTHSRENYQGMARKEIYFARILLQAIGYIGSKIINYKRKCELIGDHHKNLRLFGARHLSGRLQQVREISQLVLHHFRCEKEVDRSGKFSPAWQKLFNKPASIVYGITQSVGQMLGERLYNAVIDNHLDKQEIRQLFTAPLHNWENNMVTYFKLIRRLRDIKTTFRSKSERF